jgi:hypothetical protein
MNAQDSSDKNSLLWFSIILLVFAAGYRVLRAVYLPEMPNFSPVMAMAFCGGLFLPWRLAAGVVFGALIASDIWISTATGMGLGLYLLWQYPLYALAIAFGAVLRTKAFRLRYFYGGVLLNAIIFYLVTNTGSWMGNPAYAKTISGWIQALTVGVPGYPPTWTFFRNSLFGDMLFSSLFAGAWFLSRTKISRPARRRKGTASS